jgi:hypothetical protein
MGLELTARSVRSCVAPASGSSSGLALGAKGAEREKSPRLGLSTKELAVLHTAGVI